MSEDDEYLQDVWSVYFHNPDDQNWNLESYKRLSTISTVQDFWRVHEATRKYLTEGMFFIMREHVFPCWDDPENIKGGCLSLKLPREKLDESWEIMCQRLLGESIVSSGPNDGECNAWNSVNGMSVSPKRYFSIVKLWLREGAPTDPARYAIPSWYSSEILYRSNEENIRDRNKPSVPTTHSPIHSAKSTPRHGDRESRNKNVGMDADVDRVA